MIERLRSKGIDLKDETVLSYLDDTTLLVPSDFASTAYEAVLEAFDENATGDGFLLRPDKTVFRDSQQVATEGVCLLGTCIGPPEARSAFLASKIAKLEHALGMLPQLRSQDAQLLLRMCYLPRLSHLQRTLDPAGIEVNWTRHDRAVFNAARRMCGDFPIRPQTRDLVELPLRYGGLGLTRARTTIAVARESSISLSRWQLTEMWGETGAERALGEAIKDRPPRQHEHMRAVWSERVDSFRETLTSNELARVAANSSTVGSAWMNAAPIERGLVLSDSTVVAALNLRLLQEPRGLPGSCSRCGHLQPPANHDLSCPAMGPRRTVRHDSVKRLIAKMYRAVGRPHVTRVGLEPASTNTPQRRADILICGAAAPIPTSTCVDVSVVNLSSSKSRNAIAAAASVNRDPALLVGAALSLRYRDKLASYRNVEFPGAFLPFVITSEGAMHEQAVAAFKTLQKFKLGAIVYRFRLLLSCTLVRERAVTYYLPYTQYIGHISLKQAGPSKNSF